jgi:hypothetical protein
MRIDAGSHTLKVEPVPKVLSTVIRPPINRQRRSLMMRPSPVPPKRRLVVASACPNSLNRRLPDPGVRDAEDDSVLGVGDLTAAAQHDLAFEGEFGGIAEKIDKDLTQAHANCGLELPTRARRP